MLSIVFPCREDTPTVVYQLTDTIRSKLFNYKKFVQSLDVDAFLQDNTILPCECDHSQFLNKDHGHIISGDLNIITDERLRALLTKGPKYREPLPFSCVKAKESILVGINSCIDSWSSKSGNTKSAFTEWKNVIISKIDKRMSALVDNNKRRRTTSILKGQNSKSCLLDLQSKYVMVPIDKAASNIAFVCKRYYALVLLRELGLVGESTSTTIL